MLEVHQSISEPDVLSIATGPLTILLHDLEELDHNLGGRSEQNLSLSALLSVGKGLKAIGQHGHFRHLEIELREGKRVKITRPTRLTTHKKKRTLL